MQASWYYRCAEAVGWWLWVQGNGCNLPAVAIGVLVAVGWCSMVQPASRGTGAAGNGCSRPAGAIDALRPDAGCQLVLSGCWWLCAGGYGCRGTDAAGQRWLLTR